MVEGETLVELVRRLLDGDRKAAETLAALWLGPAYAIALAHLKRRHEAEDLAQDIVMRALSRLEQCRDPAKATAWMAGIARNQAKNAVRARRLRDVFGGVEAPESVSVDNPLQATQQRELLQGLSTLSPLQREVLLLHDLEGWSHAEIANHLRLSEANSRQLLFVARRTLRARLADVDR